jgi:hypothetical protein
LTNVGNWLKTSAPNVCRLVEVASSFAEYQIEDAFEVIVTEEGDAQRSSFISQSLNGNICLQIPTKLFLDSLDRWIR